MNNKRSGTKEWSEISENCVTGCNNGCLYCYAKSISIRYGQSTVDSWENEYVREYRIGEKAKKHKGVVMFPSMHDISPKNLKENLQFLKQLLEAGNLVLVVSKPHLECIEEICKRFKGYKDKMLFRFSIGSLDENVLKFWEPNAPSFSERFEALKLAFREGYQTSISLEPMLDTRTSELIEILSPYVTHSIWVGLPNHLLEEWGRPGRLYVNGFGTPEIIERAHKLLNSLNDEYIWNLYEKYKNHPLLKWKKEMKDIVSRLISRRTPQISQAQNLSALPND